MVQPVMPIQKLRLVLSQEVLFGPQLSHVLPHDISFYLIFVQSSKFVVIFDGVPVGVRRSSTTSRVSS